MLNLWLSVAFSAGVVTGAPPFQTVSSFGVVPLSGTVADIQTALGKAHIQHHFKVFHKTGRVYITFPTSPTGPAPAGGNWGATAYFNGKGNLVEILVESPNFPTAKEAEAAVTKLVTDLGSPEKATPEGTGQRYWIHVWRNPKVTLRASLVSNKRETHWVVTLAWRPTVAPPDSSPPGNAVPGELINRPPDR